MAKKKDPPKHTYYTHREPICECLKCGHEHVRRSRKRQKMKEEGVICRRVCPKCGASGYTYIGDKETRRVVKDDA